MLCCIKNFLLCHVIFLIVIVFEYLPVSWQERQRVIYDEQKKLTQHQAQTKSQMARYEDELARKRMQACIYWYFCVHEIVTIYKHALKRM